VIREILAFRRSRGAIPPGAALALAVVAVALIGVADYATGIEINFSILYVTPIALAAWVCGKGWGLCFAGLSAGVWFAADALGGHEYSHPAIHAWNAGVRLGFFSLIAAVLHRLRSELDRQRGLVRNLREALAQRDRVQRELKKATVDLERSNEELEDYAHVVAHDLKTPLVAISGFAQMLNRSYGAQLEPEAGRLAARVVEGADRMQGLIDDLLEYAKAGKTPGEPQLIDVNAVVDRVIRDIEPEIQKPGAEITRSDLPILKADQLRLSQVFQNLIGNAVKFCGDHTPEVQIWAERKGEEWVFSVRDNGVGIDPTNAQEIFGVFKRLPASSRIPGTGIGLAVCKKIVEASGGRIWVESQLGRGSTFRFSVPANPETGLDGTTMGALGRFTVREGEST
jgi:signal transduction histidine kinase